MVALWRVNSYGYPNPFGDPSQEKGRKALEAWAKFNAFASHSSYASLKQALNTESGLSAHAAESWKAAFEEFGLLYVITGTDEVQLSPGGRQVLETQRSGSQLEFAWAALNLLMRYPLRGKTGRRSRGEDFDESDLLLYWFLLAAMRELENHVWFSELAMVLSRVFQRNQCRPALQTIRRMRAGDIALADLEPFSSSLDERTIYNYLNQVMVHAGLGHLVVTSYSENSPYQPGRQENCWRIDPRFVDVIDSVVGANAALPISCAELAPLHDRMPAAPQFDTERDFFEYLGSPVPARRTSSVPVDSTMWGGEAVFLLDAQHHFARLNELAIEGDVQTLCFLAPNQRVLTSDRIERTFLVAEKELLGKGRVRIELRPARPTVDHKFIHSLFLKGSE